MGSMLTWSGCPLLLFVVYFFGLSAAQKIQCLDEEGHPVDWYYVSKIPLLHNHEADSVKKGVGYMFMTPKSSEWTLSTKTIEDADSIFGRTIAGMYSSEQLDDVWLAYNDQYVKGSKSSSGHTKGILGGSEEGGFWLIHSVPHFPVMSEYSYPASGHKNGQSALCVSLNAEELDKIGMYLKYTSPNIIYNRMAKPLAQKYPILSDVLKGVTIKTGPWNYKTEVTTIGGTTFKGFAKAKKFNKDLYEWVATALQTDIAVQSWPEEPQRLPSSCKIPYKVINIDQIIVQEKYAYNSTKDHSKWAMGVDKLEMVCVGDINRAVPQEKRGGGTLCLQNPKVWEAYKSLINGVESCPTNKRKHHRSRP